MIKNLENELIICSIKEQMDKYKISIYKISKIINKNGGQINITEISQYLKGNRMLGFYKITQILNAVGKTITVKSIK